MRERERERQRQTETQRHREREGGYTEKQRDRQTDKVLLLEVSVVVQDDSLSIAH